MAVIGFHFTKILTEKTKNAVGKINVSNNVVLIDVKEAKINVGDAKQKGIEFKFNYKSKFEPEIGYISLEGAALFVAKEAKIKESLTKWEKEKKLPPEVLQEVYNHLLEKCTVEALFLGRDMGLPPHVPLPKISGDKKNKKE